MVDVGVRQLERSRDRLEQGGEALENRGDQATAGLLLFYSAECGLKARIMRDQSLRDTSALPGDLRTHDLRALAKQLRLSAEAQNALAACARPQVDGRSLQQVEAHALHEAWRYGADLDADDEKHAVGALRMLILDSRK